MYSKKSLVSTIVTWKPVCRWSSSCSTWLGFGFGFGLELGFGFGFGLEFVVRGRVRVREELRLLLSHLTVEVKLVPVGASGDQQRLEVLDDLVRARVEV